MSNPRVVYSELNLAKGPKKQQRQPKGRKSSISASEQQVTYATLTLQSASQECRGDDEDHSCKGFTSLPEKFLAGTLGSICLFLVVTVIVMTTVVIPSTVIQEKNKSSWVRTPKAYRCGRCPKKWLTFSNNCYYLGVEKKTWMESLASCASKNSSLLFLDNEEELKLLETLSRPSWIGVSRFSRDRPWLWVNGSRFNLQIQKSSSDEDHCVRLSSSGFIADTCESAHTYNCKHKL
ncbi:NKG2-A/NKG2-B type II integral membrane protein [Fukomys damarensis]|uniref:NKG2-A/NKG2-B type II integral membrane protein n=1 Tax=Fukomys damarensis TaxID=885580 RepID=UPI00053F737C|nr:NKG2-A/NKG2-B type II integral membrane protein [Fukomys damarensis]